MQLSVTGISHHETPVELRERFAFAADELVPGLQRLPEYVSGGAILSTCNRSEVYLVSETALNREAGIAALVAARGPVAVEGVSFYHLQGLDAVRHLYRVASGVESLIVGESEILGQVREAFSAATAAGSGHPVLARLFHSGLRVGRRARSETEIGAHGPSVAALAVSLSRKLLGNLRRKTVLVVGAGEVGQRTAGALVQAGVGRLLVTTRRSGLAEEIAGQLNGVAVPYDQLAVTLAEADVVISATAAPESIISRGDVAAAMARRPQRSLLIVDIAVPRDVDPAARDVAGVHLFDIDDLQAAAEVNLQARQAEVGAVELLIEEELRRFRSWLDARDVAPTIAALQRRAEATRRSELERTLARLPNLSDADRRRVEAMSKSLVKRLLHAPVTRLRRDSSQRHLEAVHDLFDIDSEDPAKR